MVDGGGDVLLKIAFHPIEPYAKGGKIGLFGEGYGKV